MTLTPDMFAAGLIPGIEEPALMRSARQPLADPLWMLLRQAQFGEFQAQDAGSPAMVRLEGNSNTFTATRAGSAPPRAFDPQLMPLEPRAEGDPRAGLPALAEDRVSWGLDALRIMRAHGLAKKARQSLTAKFALKAPDEEGRGDTITPSAPHVALYGQGGLDGILLSDAMENAHPRGLFENLETGLSVLEIESLAQALMDWKKSLPQGAQQAQWSQDSLEAELDVLAPQGNAPRPISGVLHDISPNIGGDFVISDEVIAALDEPGALFPGLGELLEIVPDVTTTPADVLCLDEYHGGPVHWWHMRAKNGEDLPEAQVGRPAPPLDQVVVPTAIRFPGMPEQRLWSIEPPEHHYGALDPAPEDLARLIVAEFAISGAEGWMIAPLRVLQGSVTHLTGVTIRDVFGREETRRVHQGSQPDDPFDFGGISSADGSLGALVVMPSLPLVQNGPKIEEVSLRRDSGARLVWGVEERAQNATTGMSTDGAAAEAARPPAPMASRAPTDAAYAYRLASEVPSHWVPFMMPPAADPTAPRMLELAALLDVARNDAPPLSGQILRSLATLADEAVPPEGLRLERSMRRVRWVGGGVRTWIGRERPHRLPDAGQSGLRYDTFLPLNGPERRPAPDPADVSLRDVMSYADGTPRSIGDLLEEETGQRTGGLRDALSDMARKRSTD